MFSLDLWALTVGKVHRLVYTSHEAEREVLVLGEVLVKLNSRRTSYSFEQLAEGPQVGSRRQAACCLVRCQVDFLT
jgi:hypothetical protein